MPRAVPPHAMPLAAVPEHAETTGGEDEAPPMPSLEWRHVRQQVAELLQEVRAVAHGLRTTEAALDVHKSLMSQEFGVFRREMRAEGAAVKDIAARNATEVQALAGSCEAVARTAHREALERESAIAGLKKEIQHIVKIEVARLICCKSGKPRSLAFLPGALEIGPHRLAIPDTQQLSARIRALAVDIRPTPRTGSEPPTARSWESSYTASPDTARDRPGKKSPREDDGRPRLSAAERRAKLFTFDEASVGSQASTELASECGAPARSRSSDSARTALAAPTAPATPAFVMGPEIGDGLDAPTASREDVCVGRKEVREALEQTERGPTPEDKRRVLEDERLSAPPVDSPRSFSARGIVDCAAPLNVKLAAAVAAVRAQSPKVFQGDGDSGQVFSFRASRDCACETGDQAHTHALVEKLVEKIEEEFREDFQQSSAGIRGLSPLLEAWGAPAPPEIGDDLSFEQRLDRLLAEVAVVPRITPRVTPRVTPRGTPQSSPAAVSKARRVSSSSHGNAGSPEPHPEPIRGSSPGPDHRDAHSHTRDI